MTANEMVAAAHERRFDFSRLSGLAAASEVGQRRTVAADSAAATWLSNGPT